MTNRRRLVSISPANYRTSFPAVGAGLGAAGQSEKLSEGAGGKEEGVATDNGYLAQLDELGPVGFLLVLVAMSARRRRPLRGERCPGWPGAFVRAALLAIDHGPALAHAGGDILYGVTAIFFWYIAGVAMAIADPAHPPAERRENLRPRHATNIRRVRLLQSPPLAPMR